MSITTQFSLSLATLLPIIALIYEQIHLPRKCNASGMPLVVRTQAVEISASCQP